MKKHRFQRKISHLFVDFFEKLRIIGFCMDTKHDSRIPKCGEVPDLSTKHMVVGTKQLKKALLGGRAKRVYLARNADPAITEPLEALCKQCNVACDWVASKSDLGRACGIEVGAAAAAAVD